MTLTVFLGFYKILHLLMDCVSLEWLNALKMPDLTFEIHGYENINIMFLLSLIFIGKTFIWLKKENINLAFIFVYVSIISGRNTFFPTRNNEVITRFDLWGSMKEFYCFYSWRKLVWGEILYVIMETWYWSLDIGIK